jgi:hypothetical protein
MPPTTYAATTGGAWSMASTGGAPIPDPAHRLRWIAGDLKRERTGAPGELQWSLADARGLRRNCIPRVLSFLGDHQSRATKMQALLRSAVSDLRMFVILRLQMEEVNVRSARKRARNNSSAMPKCLLVRRADKHAAHAPGRFAGNRSGRR